MAQLMKKKKQQQHKVWLQMFSIAANKHFTFLCIVNFF